MRGPPRRAAACLVAAAATFALAGCASSPSQWSEVGGPVVAEAEIHEQTVRYAVRYYAPGPGGGLPAAFCLSVGRRSAGARGPVRSDNREVWLPGARLLSRLGDLRPPVVAATECEENDAREEIHVPSGRPAVAMYVSEPRYVTPGRADVLLSTFESPRYAFSYRCEVVREGVGWSVRRCL